VHQAGESAAGVGISSGDRARRRLRCTGLIVLAGFGLLVSGLFSSSAAALPFSFSTGSPDGAMAMASRPTGEAEIETGDDFVLDEQTILTSATFTGLLPLTAPLSSIQQVRVKVYVPFPAYSNVAPTSGPPTYSTAKVPTRVNSPADAAFVQSDNTDGSLSFTASVLNSEFTASNSVQSGGIHPAPGYQTGGNGPVNGEEVAFDATFSPPLMLAAGHYFFEPQVLLSSGEYLWLSAPGASFPAGSADFPSWIRDASLAPDWLRVGRDIVGGSTPPNFNAAFSLAGTRCHALSIAPTSIPPATSGSAYSASFAASGGVPPYSFGETGTLPGGVSLTTSGKLSGTPARAGSFPIAVTVTDAEGCQGTANVTLTVRAPGSAGGAKGTTKGGSSNTTGLVPPNTKISSAKVSSRKQMAKFKFKATGSSSGFECALVKRHRRPKFRKCRSPKTCRRLRVGKYTFEVRALGSAGVDPTPAKRRFKIRPA
jgi:hypothetical protein